MSDRSTSFAEEMEQASQRIVDSFNVPPLAQNRFAEDACCPRCGAAFPYRRRVPVIQTCPACGWVIGDPVPTAHYKLFMNDARGPRPKTQRHPALRLIVVWAIFFFAGGVAFGIGIGLVIAQ